MRGNIVTFTKLKFRARLYRRVATSGRLMSRFKPLLDAVKRGAEGRQ